MIRLRRQLSPSDVGCNWERNQNPQNIIWTPTSYDASPTPICIIYGILISIRSRRALLVQPTTRIGPDSSSSSRSEPFRAPSFSFPFDASRPHRRVPGFQVVRTIWYRQHTVPVGGRSPRVKPSSPLDSARQREDIGSSWRYVVHRISTCISGSLGPRPTLPFELIA